MEDSVEIQVYKLIRNSVSKSSLTIRNKSWLDKQDITHDIYIDFIDRGYINKFDSNKGKLSAFVFTFVKWYLLGQLRKKPNPEMLFTDLSRLNDGGKLQDFEIMDFNTPEEKLLEKTKEKNIKNLKRYILGRK